MSSNRTLTEAFIETEYKIAGHGNRDIAVLKEALDTVPGDLASDMYGNGKVIEEFQEKMATYLGKESAVFFPSGTMAQQIALRIWCDEKGTNKVAYHPLAHLEIHEQDGLKELHHIETVLLADKDRLITLDDVKNIDENIACLLLELPQREIGGQLPDFQTIVDISDYCKEKGIKLHLDGARLFEILPYYKKTAAEICSLFDSVYVSFYKGLGGVAGAILAGEKDFVEQSKIWKRRHGGDLISLYPYVISSDYYFEQRKDKMAQYYEEAKELANFYNQCQLVTTKPQVPVSNMFHVHIKLPKEQLEQLLIKVYEETSVGLTSYLKETSDSSCYYEVSIGDRYKDIPKVALEKAFKVLDENIKSL